MADPNLPGAPLFAPDGKSSKYIPHEQVLGVLSSTAPVRTAEGQDAFYTKDGWYLLLETPENTDRILKMGEKYEPIRLEPGQGNR
ncbi:hypothetical protein I302_108026 [Kwoniella bestiolae CBS 10118]|uniref:Uncharacterized protein n=1 Tax=Kwoniella bestiolae CBS 10118 TaxID=1296100 RepID=A0A1B9FWW1_9TREE|nr:hypothetical protein I302_07608 [Kwoniella bestiolae CBS 10118]OCF23254.1 hypothetical protein I302_07608 [Kwoniella bestiolae CBS 10118]